MRFFVLAAFVAACWGLETTPTSAFECGYSLPCQQSVAYVTRRKLVGHRWVRRPIYHKTVVAVPVAPRCVRPLVPPPCVSPCASDGQGGPVGRSDDGATQWATAPADARPCTKFINGKRYDNALCW